MAPPLLHLRDIALTFGGTPLLTSAELQVGEGERIGLVGRNGSGKSTLLKIAAGLVEADAGERFVQPGRTIRYLPQEPDLAGHATVLDYASGGLAPGDDAYRAQYLLDVLGLRGDEDPATLSGGEKRRAALARTLAPEPDILLLDEPTNHLDLPAIEWLESELSSMKSALVLISHDRRFLADLTRATVWIDRGVGRRHDRGFAHFEAWRDEVFEQEERDQQKLAQKIKREEHWMTYGVTARRKRNMRRVRELADLRAQKKAHRGPQGNVRMTVGETEVSGKRVIEARGITKDFGPGPVVDGFSTRILRGDRVALVGANGAGKTTLLKMLTGALEPDSGTVILGSGLTMVTMDQSREALKKDETVSEILTGGGGDQVMLSDGPRHVVSYMKDFLFAPEQARTPVSALSGGERGRLLLARALARASNLLVLDEPTNDLDLETLDLLQEMLADYPGTVLLVSHDRDFLDRVATSVVFAEGNGVWREYAGGYSDMIAQRGAGVAARKSVTEGGGRTKAADDKTGASSSGGNSGGNASGDGATSEKAKKKSKLTFSQQHQLKTLPKEIDKLGAEIGKLQGELEDQTLYARDPKRFDTLMAKLSDLQSKLATAEETWLELEMLAEEG